VFWNHQAWKGEEAGKWLDVHTTLYDNGWMHGMEVCNGDSYYPTAHQWCLDRNLTMMGNTDIHAPDLLVRSEPGKHRTLTLVFAKDRTLEALHESLKERRTAVWFNDQIIGRQEWLAPLLNGCVSIAKPHMRSKDAVWVEMRNTSDVDVKLKRTGKAGPAELVLPAQSTSVVKIGTSNPGEPIELAYEATNFLIAPNTGLLVTWQVAGP
jgi:hypothetical protein